jgi:hypothetical protein
MVSISCGSRMGGETARAITGHVTVKMTEHYSHFDVDKKRAAVEGMLSLVRGGDETPPSNENHTAQDITGEGETGEAKTGTLAGTSSGKSRHIRGERRRGREENRVIQVT